jgi:hypothetical protein
MIDAETKHKLLAEIAKSGNVYLSCIKTGVDKSTYYRWRKEDKGFKKEANLAQRQGRENNCDVAEQSLMLLVKDKKLEAIKYVLSHNSPRYKPKRTNSVVIEHRTASKIPLAPAATLEDVLKSMDEGFEKKIDSLKQRFAALGGIPLKADGSAIEDEELEKYEGYIEEWYKRNEIKKLRQANPSAKLEEERLPA